MKLDAPEWAAAGTVLAVWILAIIVGNTIDGEAAGFAIIIIALVGIYLGGKVRNALSDRRRSRDRGAPTV